MNDQPASEDYSVGDKLEVSCSVYRRGRVPDLVVKWFACTVDCVDGDDVLVKPDCFEGDPSIGGIILGKDSPRLRRPNDARAQQDR